MDLLRRYLLCQVQMQGYLLDEAQAVAHQPIELGAVWGKEWGKGIAQASARA